MTHCSCFINRQTSGKLYQGEKQSTHNAHQLWVVLVSLKFWHFSPERTQTWSLGATESEVWIGNLNVKAWKTTKHKLHKSWRSLKFCKKIQENEHAQMWKRFSDIIFSRWLWMIKHGHRAGRSVSKDAGTRCGRCVTWYITCCSDSHVYQLQEINITSPSNFSYIL